MNLKKEKSVMSLAARSASKVLLHYFGKKEAIKVKSNKSLVATADLEANEESPFEDNQSDFKWVIDPLDGTHNFLHGIPVFGTSIALEHKNEVILGILNFPALGMTAIAERGQGAFLNGKRIKVSRKNNLEHAFLLFEFSYANRKEKTDFLERLIHKTIDIRNFGCAVYHLLLVACGKSDAFVILTTNEWDVAAGFLLAEEAGGKISDLEGNPYHLRGNKFLISNGKIHDKLLRFIENG